MATCLARFNRLYSSLIFLVFTANVFAYTPPATPDLPLSYEFLGSNAESESTAFYNSQCDSKKFSWYGVDWFCATGDPANPVCYVKMAYHATDVNKCQDSGGTDPDPENPDPNPDNLQPTNSFIMYPTTFTTELKDVHKDLGIVYDAILRGARQSFNTKTAIDMQTGSIARDLAELTRHVDASGDGIYTVLQEIRTDINSQTNWVSQNQMILAESKNLLKSIDSKTGSGSGGGTGNNYGDYMPALGYIANSVGNLSSLSNIVGNTAQIGAINNILSGSINSNLSKIAGQVGKPADNSAIIEQLVEANNGLSDIVIRMRDIENAIGKSEKSIVDAIGKGGDGTEPDLVSSADCASFSCSSSSAICYIARKEWEKSCASSGQDAENQAGVDKLTNQLKEYIDSPDSSLDNIDAGKINTTTLLNHYSDSNGVSVGGSNTCPPPYTVDIVITTVTIDLSPFCDLAAVIRWFLIAFATVGAGLMIAKYS
ncbi:MULTISPECIES: virulence factor TspB C-terminal domain-related protein [unclassified Shewanella]|uniref:virulence factor TspB C-terminal domain-related protein n=1 Tax=unclassified Shewanella TaxID=196818 RepID=UPI0021DA3B97|nr:MULTISPECIES: virulence factor TspB C-terminal domain-related protein [unclassified Shewanella]MCU8036857.1 hypothetical protein [Shewanella sp. SM71]MCU8097001.1 hypothetical protein [Shewanella sp. SM102]